MSLLLQRFTDEKTAHIEARTRYRTAAEARIETHPLLVETGEAAVKAAAEAAAAAAAEAEKARLA